MKFAHLSLAVAAALGSFAYLARSMPSLAGPVAHGGKHRIGRNRAPGKRQPAGSKLARLAIEGRCATVRG